MTDQQWLEAKDPIKMLLFLEKRRIRARKLRLIAAACCRRAWLEITDPRCHLAIEALGKFADSPGKQADKMELTRAHVAAEAAVADTEEESRQFWVARCVAAASEPTEAMWAAGWTVDLWLTAVRTTDRPEEKKAAKEARQQEATYLAHLLRDGIGNPRRPIVLDPTCLTTNVRDLAEAAYQNHNQVSGELDQDRLLVLADALEEAGGLAELLEHLRGAGPFARCRTACSRLFRGRCLDWSVLRQTALTAGRAASIIDPDSKLPLVNQKITVEWICPEITQRRLGCQ